STHPERNARKDEGPYTLPERRKSDYGFQVRAGAFEAHWSPRPGPAQGDGGRRQSQLAGIIPFPTTCHPERVRLFAGEEAEESKDPCCLTAAATHPADTLARASHLCIIRDAAALAGRSRLHCACCWVGVLRLRSCFAGRSSYSA